jgi:GNAT superfamily N-acetyltransferase
MTLTAPALLTAGHRTDAFDCGQATLNTWLKRHALANQDRGSSRTYVVCADERVVAYYAIAAGSIVHADAIGGVRRNMPEPVPVALLGRLAVDVSVQGQGIGKHLLQDAVIRVAQASDVIGMRAIVVDALDEQAKAFYERYGFVSSPISPFKLMVTIEAVLRQIPFKIIGQ